jgi:hypothetical protein
VGEYKTKRAKYSHVHFFVMFFQVCVFCYCFACGVFDCAMIFFCSVILLMKRVEKGCKCFVLIAHIAPIILLLVDCAEANVFSRRPHIGGIFIILLPNTTISLIFDRNSWVFAVRIQRFMKNEQAYLSIRQKKVT